jgi:hypothetical protein
MDELAASGAPAIVLITRSKETEALFQAMLRHKVMSSTDFLWVGINSWIGYDLGNIPEGSIGTVDSPVVTTHGISAAFMDLWRSLDPEKYPDYDGDRSTLALFSAFAVDAVVAMATAYQGTIDANYLGSERGRRESAYAVLVGSVSFEGISGTVSLDANGDREHSSFQFVNSKGPQWWDSIGSIDLAGDSHYDIFINASNIVWPNSKRGGAYAQNYAMQYEPLCPAGSEPILKGSTYYCEECRVGYYKSNVGSEPCSLCPEGADCNDVGIVVPCILPGYWRAEPPAGEEGDFCKWEVFRCDISSRCLGGCQLNATCAANVRQDSPVCAVCEDGFYASDESCNSCPAADSLWAAFEYFAVILFFTIVLFALVALYALQLHTVLGINIFSGTTKDGPQESIIGKEDENSDGNQNRSPSLLRSNRKFARSVRYASILVDLIRSHGLYVTVKLTLSFLQVLMGTIPRLNIEWSASVSMFENFPDLNLLHYFPIFSGCNSKTSLRGPFIYILLVAFAPLAFLCGLGLVKWIMQRLLHRNALQVLASNATAVDKVMFDVTLKAIVWFCLLSFPLLAAG